MKLIFLSLLLATVAQGQTTTTRIRLVERLPRYHRTIPQVALLMGDTQQESLVNWSAGFSFDYGYWPNLVVETGLLYDSFGKLSIPVAAKFYFSGHDSTSFFVKGGGQFHSTGPVVSVLGGVGLKYILTSKIDLYWEADYLRTIQDAQWSLVAGIAVTR